MTSAFCAVPARSVIVTVCARRGRAVVGVPEITPVAGSSERPSGSAGLTANVAGPERSTVGARGAIGAPAAATTSP